MRAVDHYPPDTVTGACFVLGRFELAPGEMVVDLDRDLEFLPAVGRLCVSEDAVREMNRTLGWRLWTEEAQVEFDATLEALSDVIAQRDELMDAVAGMVNLPAVERALEVAARQIAGKDSIAEWIDTLPPKVTVTR
jgi:hypothetical protein